MGCVTAPEPSEEVAASQESAQTGCRCNCVALSSNQTDPVRGGPGVRCLAAPCDGHTAACVAGTCTVL